jgi:acylphosphatase
MKRVELIATGRVQGVWFRYETQKAALEIGVKGIVENTVDGAVHVLAEGEEGQLDKLIEYCKHGPPLARVENVRISWSEPTGEFSGFTIRH